MSEDDLPEVLFRARLHRAEKDTPWGFRLQGGVEFNKPLTLLKVSIDEVMNLGTVSVRSSCGVSRTPLRIVSSLHMHPGCMLDKCLLVDPRLMGFA